MYTLCEVLGVYATGQIFVSDTVRGLIEGKRHTIRT
jgi:hypothetical protein